MIGKFILLLLALLVGLGLAVYFIWPPNHIEIQPLDTAQSPDGQWAAVVQLEVYTTAWIVNDAVYVVRLKKAQQANVKGDLVMNVPVNYSVPKPSIAWRDGTLMVTLAKEQSYQYFVNTVDGVPVVLQRNNRIDGPPSSNP